MSDREQIPILLKTQRKDVSRPNGTAFAILSHKYRPLPMHKARLAVGYVE
jgi:hypothetical protein